VVSKVDRVHLRIERADGSVRDTIAPILCVDGRLRTSLLLHAVEMEGASITARRDGSRLRGLTGPLSLGAGLSWSPDGKYLVAAGSPARLINVANGFTAELPLGGDGAGISWWR
jgi:hypothetical protein